ncbi:MAG: hypothetical protein QHI38_13820 [Armatimonadota bacterium]|nr:hypothetical protein [Armatimonadota bacterium]
MLLSCLIFLKPFACPAAVYAVAWILLLVSAVFLAIPPPSPWTDARVLSRSELPEALGSFLDSSDVDGLEILRQADGTFLLNVRRHK